MVINVSEAIDCDTAEVITVRRYATGSRVDGVWVDGATSTFKALASAQPATPMELQILPEGERDKVVFKFISNKPIRTTQDRDCEQADDILFKGHEWKVINPGDWSSYGHNTVLAAKI